MKRLLPIILLLFSSCSNLSYVEKWTDINVSAELNDAVTFDDSFQGSIVHLHGIVKEAGREDFISKHNLKRNEFDQDYIAGNFSDKEIAEEYKNATKKENIYMKRKDLGDKSHVFFEQWYYDTGNASLWITVVSD